MFTNLRATLTVVTLGSLLAVTACTTGPTASPSAPSAEVGSISSAANGTSDTRGKGWNKTEPTPTETSPTAPETGEPLPTVEPTEPAPEVVSPSPVPTSPAPSPAPVSDDEFIFGLGSQAYQIEREPLVQQAPVGMYTSWYNFRSDLGFFDLYKNGVTPQTYAAGKAMHLVVWPIASKAGAWEKDGWVDTKYGKVCGASYPLSREFQADMVQLAKDTAGSADGPPLYVSMFTEFTTYPCGETGGSWKTGEPYYKALKDAYMEAMNTFHTYAPNSKVGLTWGGWEITFGTPEQQNGKYLIPFFKDVMDASDIQSFQAMSTTENVDQTTNMVKELSKYGTGKSLLAHYKPDDSNTAVFDRDMAGFFTPTKMAELKANGLFGFSFLDPELLSSSPSRFEQVKTAIQTYAKSAG